MNCAMKKIWHVLRGFLVFIGVVVVALAGIGVWSFRAAEPPLPAKIVLSYNFMGTPQDGPGAPQWLSSFMPVDPSLSEITDSLYLAARDKRVTAFVARLSDGDYDWADVQELQAAIAAFKAAGKKTYVYAESYGDLYPGMAEYYLASSFDEIWIQPMGSVAITGFHAEVPYVKKTLDLLGIQPDILQRGEYKTAPESALLEHMSDPQRQTLHAILSSMMTDFFETVAKGRNLPAARIGQLIDAAPYTADEAKERKLVDQVGYADQLMAQLVPDQKKDDEGFVDAADYLYGDSKKILNNLVKKEKKLADKKEKNGLSVALVYVSGMIVSGTTGQSGFFGESMAYADDISQALLDAADDDNVGAIILRVASPGGSPAASETIRRAVEVAKSKGKYVVVSMGSEAASGGYWVSVDANRIFAQPGTLTGSIGVFGGKIGLGGMWNKAGVNWDSVELGANAGLWSQNRAYSDDGRAAVGRMLDQIYDGFIARVAKGRNFAPEVVESMAQGRVWTGRQAKERGLIDEIGGLHEAMVDVAKKLGVSDVSQLDIFTLPDAPSPLEDIMGFVSGGAQTLSPLKPLLKSYALATHPQWALVHAPSFAIQH